MKPTHEYFLLQYAINAHDDARLAVKLALREPSANNRLWMLKWAREEASRYKARLAEWWKLTRLLAAVSA